jgi:hypothetical protein
VHAFDSFEVGWPTPTLTPAAARAVQGTLILLGPPHRAPARA